MHEALKPLIDAGWLDIQRLRLALGEAVDVGKERYGMMLPGKADR